MDKDVFGKDMNSASGEGKAGSLFHEPITPMDVTVAGALATLGAGIDWAAKLDSSELNAKWMTRSGLSLVVTVGVLFEFKGYFDALKSGNASTEFTVEVGGTLGGLVGGAIGSWAAGVFIGAAGGATVGGGVLSIPLSVAGAVVGGFAGDQATEFVMRRFIEGFTTNREYPHMEWRRRTDPFGLSRFDPNPYERPDPEFGEATIGGYTGLNSGYDTPRELTPPSPDLRHAPGLGTTLPTNPGASAPTTPAKPTSPTRHTIDLGPSTSPNPAKPTESTAPLVNPRTAPSTPGPTSPIKTGTMPTVPLTPTRTRTAPSDQPLLTDAVLRELQGSSGSHGMDVIQNSVNSRNDFMSGHQGFTDTIRNGFSQPPKEPEDWNLPDAGLTPPLPRTNSGGGRPPAGGNDLPSTGPVPPSRPENGGGETEDPAGPTEPSTGFVSPVLLDLTGNGLTVDPLDSSDQFIDLGGDGYQHRAAWAGEGTGVLVLDADGDGKVSRTSEFVFTEWDPTAAGDLDALRSVFDTNGNGKLDSGDTRWGEFRVMVDGQLVSLASLGIQSIDLIPTGSGQSFSDGSAITGTTTYTRTDGSTGMVGDALLAVDGRGYLLSRDIVTNADGSTVETLQGRDRDGSLAFTNRIMRTADGRRKTTSFDDNGDGVSDRAQTDELAIAADGTRTRTVTHLNADGSLRQKVVTATSVGGGMVTTSLDQDGDGHFDQTQVFTVNPSGSTTTTTAEFSADGSLLRKEVTTAGAAGLSKIVQVDSTGRGVFDLTRSETTTVGAGGERTKVETLRSQNGSLISKTITTIGDNGRTQTVEHDLDGDGDVDLRRTTALWTQSDGDAVSSVSSVGPDGSSHGRVVTTSSADGLSKTTETDITGDGVTDFLSSDVTTINGAGARTRTVEQRSSNSTLLSRVVTTTSADGRNIRVDEDVNGDGSLDFTRETVELADGSRSTSIVALNPDGSQKATTTTNVSADGLTQTTRNQSGGTFDFTTQDKVTTDSDGSRARTVSVWSKDGELVRQTVVRVLADGLTTIERADIDGDGLFDRETTDAVVLNANGSRTQTITTRSRDGSLLERSVTTVSSDRKTTNTAVDEDGDGRTDRTGVAVVQADGGRRRIITETTADGSLKTRIETTLSADGFSETVNSDIDGDGTVDEVAASVEVINPDGSHTTTTTRQLGTSLSSRTVTSVSANGLLTLTYRDLNGDGNVDASSRDATTLNADGSRTRVVTNYAGTSIVKDSTTTTTSANGLTVVVGVDLDGDGTHDRTATSTKTMRANGSTLETIIERSADGSLLSKLERSTSSDGHSVGVLQDSNGDGTNDLNRVIAISSDGSTTLTEKRLNPNGTTASITQTVTSADGLSKTVRRDVTGDGEYDFSEIEVVTFGLDGSRISTITSFSRDGTIIGKRVVTVSADGLRKTEATGVNTDGYTDWYVTESVVLGADGIETRTVTTTSRDGTLLSKAVSVTAPNGYSTTTYDDNGDGTQDRFHGSSTGSDGTRIEWHVDLAAEGSRSDTYVSADGLTKRIEVDGDDDGVYDSIIRETTTLNADGSRTTTTTDELSSAKVVTTRSADGLSVIRHGDQDGNGVADWKTSDVTTFGADGSSTRTVSEMTGSGALIGRTVATISANRLTKTFEEDLDGDASIDRTTATTKSFAADGSVSDTVSSKSGNGQSVFRETTVISADKRWKETRTDIDGDQVDDLLETIAIGQNGDTVSRVATYVKQGAQGILASRSVETISADGLTIKRETDLDGNGTVDRTTESVTVLNANGSRTKTIDELGANLILTGKTVVETGASGLSETVKWSGRGSDVTRTRSSVRTIRADGTTVDTVTFLKAGGALESKTVTTTSAGGRSATTTKDIDGDGVIDQKSVATVNADGSVVTVFSDLAANGVSVVGRTTVTESGNKLSSTTDYDSNGDGVLDKRIVRSTILGANGSIKEVVTGYNSSLAATEREIVSTSADGLFFEKSWDLTSGGDSWDKQETYVTTLNANGSKTLTITESEGDAVTSRSQTTTSANGLSINTKWDTDGDGTFDQTMTDATVLEGDGTTVRTMRNTKADGSLISETIRTSSSDGRTVSVTEERPDFGNRTTVTSSRELSDGSKIETIVVKNASGQVVEKLTTTKSHDGREVGISRDVDGDGTTDQTETTTVFVDGSRQTIVTGYGNNGTKANVTTTVTSADGLTTTSEWDVDGNGSADSRRTIARLFNADGSQRVTTSDVTAAGILFSKTVRSVSADGRTIVITKDVDGNGTNDSTETTIKDISGVATTTLVNNVAARDVDKLIAGEIYWDRLIAAKIETKTSADGATETVRSDFDGNGTFEHVVVSTRRLDGSVASTITETKPDGSVKARGTMVESADGRTKTLRKDANNDGVFELTRTASTALDGAVNLVAVEKNANNTVKQTVTDEISATGKLLRRLTTDPAGRKIAELLVLADGSMTDTTFDAASGKVLTVSTYDNRGAITEKTFYDALNTEDWVNSVHSYDASERLTQELTTKDNGTTVKVLHDVTDTQTWLKQTQFLDSAGRLTEKLDENDDGTSEGTLYDPADTHSWGQLKEVKNAAGQRTLYTIYNDDGTSTTTSYDPTDVAGWKTIDRIYHASGLYRTIQTNDDLTKAITTYDIAAAEIWSQQVVYYDVSERKTQEIFTNDDGTKTKVLHDSTDVQLWSKQEQYLDGAGRLTVRKDYMDVGGAETTWYDVAEVEDYSQKKEVRNSANQITNLTLYGDNGTTNAYFYDPADVAGWKQILRVYTAAGHVQTIQINDNNSTLTTWYDPADANTWSTKTETTNTSGKVTQTTADYDDGSRVVIDHDPTDVQSWSQMVKHYDAADRLTQQNTTNDSGTKQTIWYDVAKTKEWVTLTQNFTSDNKLTSQIEVGDNGTTETTIFDPLDLQAWAQTVELKNSAGQRTHYTVYQDDGTSTVTISDPTGAYGWSSQVNYYDAAGRRTRLVQTNDNGTKETRVYDPTDAQLWTETLTVTTASGVKMREAVYQDDGSHSVTYYDYDNSESWRQQTEYYNAANILVSVVLTRDDGTTITTPPVVLDLDGDQQIELKQLDTAEIDAGAGPRFDWDGDGVRDATAWAGSDDGFLALDLAADGSAGPDGEIDQARELVFAIWGRERGAAAGVSDLEGLRLAFDSNGNNLLDGGDDRWAEFRIWQDSNQDGLTDPGELRTLDEVGIVSIGLTPSTQGAHELSDGSAVSGTSSFVKADGTTGLAGDTALAFRSSQWGNTVLGVDGLIAAMAGFQPATGSGSWEGQSGDAAPTDDWQSAAVAKPGSQAWMST